jgi:murein DD-endopeptidase MepM/ murein hydrolase activator NlpD
MHRLKSNFDTKTNRRRATALLSTAALFLVVLLATSAQAAFGLDFFQPTDPEVVETPDGICPTPTPTDTPTLPEGQETVDDLPEQEDPDCIEPTPTEPDDDDDGKGPGNGDGNNGGKDHNGGGDSDNNGDGKKGDGADRKSGDKSNGKGKKSEGKKSGEKGKKGKKGKGKLDLSGNSSGHFKGKFNATGDFDTDKLQFIAAKLRAFGVPEERILEEVYPPFILAGPAAWTNTWGAPRYGPGPIVRTHEGQDVFCKYGDPVLATQDGEIEFDDGGLGGRVARLFRNDGSYWYYAHLSDWNTKDFKSGDKVEAGDVIGFCGNTGNAISTPPHVHFGWYQKNGSSRNPMGYLVHWLKDAEDQAAAAYKRITGEEIDELDVINSRLFGDGFAPDISELKVSSESLLASGSLPESGALGLAETALRAALADGDDVGDQREVDDVRLDVGGAGEGKSGFEDFLDETAGASD